MVLIGGPSAIGLLSLHGAFWEFCLTILAAFFSKICLFWLVAPAKHGAVSPCISSPSNALRWRHRVCFAIRGPSGVCKAASMNGQHGWFHATFEYFSPRLPAYLQWMMNNGLKDPEPQPGEQCYILRRRVQESLPAAQCPHSFQPVSCLKCRHSTRQRDWSTRWRLVHRRRCCAAFGGFSFPSDLVAEEVPPLFLSRLQGLTA